MVLVASCSTAPGRQPVRSDEELLTERVTGYCNARKNFDWNAVHAMVSPDLREETKGYFDNLISKGRNAELIDCSVKEVKISGENAEVTTNMTIKIDNPLTPNLVPQVYTMKDDWSKVEGIWYLRMKKPNLSQFLKSFGIPKKGGDRQ